MTLSFVMLIGTTFAWFTDTVSSGNNKIVAGNLDVEVTHTNKNVTDEALDKEGAKLFPVELWEPTENDNDYNVNGNKTVSEQNEGKDQLYIDIVVNVVAKQRTYEEDNFDNNYDSSSDYAIGSPERVQALVAVGYKEVKTSDDMVKALTSDGEVKIVVSNDVVCEERIASSKKNNY